MQLTQTIMCLAIGVTNLANQSGCQLVLWLLVCIACKTDTKSISENFTVLSVSLIASNKHRRIGAFNGHQCSFVVRACTVGVCCFLLFSTRTIRFNYYYFFLEKTNKIHATQKDSRTGGFSYISILDLHTQEDQRRFRWQHGSCQDCLQHFLVKNALRCALVRATESFCRTDMILVLASL